jgi:hypothetical protein
MEFTRLGVGENWSGHQKPLTARGRLEAAGCPFEQCLRSTDTESRAALDFYRDEPAARINEEELAVVTPSWG